MEKQKRLQKKRKREDNEEDDDPNGVHLERLIKASGFEAITLCQIKIALGMPMLKAVRSIRYEDKMLEGIINHGDDSYFVDRLDHYTYAEAFEIANPVPKSEEEDEESTRIDWIVQGLAMGRLRLFYRSPDFLYTSLERFTFITAGHASGAFVRKVGFWKYYYRNDISPTLPRVTYIPGKKGVVKSQGLYILGKRHGIWETFNSIGELDGVFLLRQRSQNRWGDYSCNNTQCSSMLFPSSVIRYHQILYWNRV